MEKVDDEDDDGVQTWPAFACCYIVLCTEPIWLRMQVISRGTFHIPQILPWLASIDFPAPSRKKVRPQKFDQNNTSNNSFDRSAVETRALNDLTTYWASTTLSVAAESSGGPIVDMELAFKRLSTPFRIWYVVDPKFILLVLEWSSGCAWESPVG
jgi:hypothetical protein